MLMEVKNLKTGFEQRKGILTAVDDINFQLYRGEILGIVGESGSGKTQTALAALRLLAAPACIMQGEVFFEGEDLLKKSEKEMLSIRGKKIAMIFQDSLAALDPVVTCGNQMFEMIRLHDKTMKKIDMQQKCEKALASVEIHNPLQVMRSYPYELSGGMCQRVMIAMSLLNDPELLIADEPTTALDVTVQAQILELLKELCKKRNMSIVIVTHDLGVVADITDRTAVMYLGKMMEIGPTATIIHNPVHPYTQGLLKSIPNHARMNQKLYMIEGNVPDLNNLPTGCRFSTRCPVADGQCKNASLADNLCGDGEHKWRCHKAFRKEENDE
jgi:peptide/nickel transport system ATP-binding protein